MEILQFVLGGFWRFCGFIFVLWSVIWGIVMVGFTLISLIVAWGYRYGRLYSNKSDCSMGERMSHTETLVHLSVDDTLEMAMLTGHLSSGSVSRLEKCGFSTIRDVLDYENEKQMSLRFVMANIGQKTQAELYKLRRSLQYPFGQWRL